jgi:Tfp pilus assembly protein PilO
MVLNTPMKIVLTVVVIFLVGIGFYLLDYQGKLTEIKNLESSLIQKQEQMKTNELRVKALPDQLNKREKLTKELNGLIQQKLPKENAAVFVPKFIQSMEELIASERIATGDKTLEVVSITPGRLEQTGGSNPDGGKPPSGGEIKALVNFPKQPFQVSIRAKYSTCIHFLYQLSALKLERLVTIQRISLSPAESTQYGRSPTLAINIPMIAYLNEGNKDASAPAP